MVVWDFEKNGKKIFIMLFLNFIKVNDVTSMDNTGF